MVHRDLLACPEKSIPFPRVYRPIRVAAVASENGTRRGGGRRLWSLQGRGRQRSMAPFSTQPEGTGPIFPISSSLAYTRYALLLPPRTRKNRLPSATARICRYTLGESSGQAWDRAQQVVIDDHHSQQQKENEGNLIDTFLYRLADIASHQAFHQQKQDQAAIQDRNR